jgi:exopolysaccharide production protein ExoQ
MPATIRRAVRRTYMIPGFHADAHQSGSSSPRAFVKPVDALAVPAHNMPRVGRNWGVAVPLLGLAYATLIQPLLTFHLNAGQDDLDLAINARSAESNPVNQLFWLSLLAIAVVIFWRRLKLIRDVASQPAGLLICLYLAVALLSTAWSPVPSIALRRWVLQVVVVLCGLFGTYLAQDRTAVARASARLMCGVALVNLPIVLFQGAGRLGGSLGIYSNKNLLGLMMVVAIAFIVYGIAAASSRFERFVLGVAVAGATISLVLSDSVTSIALVPLCLILAAILLLLSRMLRMPLALLLLVTLLSLACVLVTYFACGGSWNAILLTLFGDATFSGRTEIWAFVSDAIRDRPLQGSGYASFWGTGQNSRVMETAPGFIVALLQAHNGYLDVLVELGAIGFILLLAIVAACFRLLDYRQGARAVSLRWLLLSLMLFAVTHNLMESSWFRGFAAVWYVFLMAVGMGLSDRWLALPDHSRAPDAGLRSEEGRGA